MQKQQHGAVGLAGGGQAVGGLKGHHRPARAVAEHAVGLAPVIAEFAQGGLHVAHGVADVAALERLGGVASGKGLQIRLPGKRVFIGERGKRRLVQPAGDFQTVGGLKIAHGGVHVLRALAQIAQFGKPRLRVHRLRQRGKGAKRQAERRQETDGFFHDADLRCAFST